VKLPFVTAFDGNTVGVGVGVTTVEGVVGKVGCGVASAWTGFLTPVEPENELSLQAAVNELAKSRT